MSESKAGAGAVCKFGDVEIHVDEVTWLQDFLEKVVEPLQAENVQLTKDLDYANKCWQEWAVKLREAHKVNLWLLEKLKACSPGGN